MDNRSSEIMATDISGNGHHGVITGASFVEDSGNGSAFALNFEDGDSISLGGLDVYGNELTLAAWVKADSFGGENMDGRIISKADGIAANRHIFMLGTARRGASEDVVLRGRVRISGNLVGVRANKGLMFPDVWYHTALVLDQSNLAAYSDEDEHPFRRKMNT